MKIYKLSKAVITLTLGYMLIFIINLNVQLYQSTLHNYYRTKQNTLITTNDLQEIIKANRSKISDEDIILLDVCSSYIEKQIEDDMPSIAIEQTLYIISSVFRKYDFSDSVITIVNSTIVNYRFLEVYTQPKSDQIIYRFLIRFKNLGGRFNAILKEYR